MPGSTATPKPPTPEVTPVPPTATEVPAEGGGGDTGGDQGGDPGDGQGDVPGEIQDVPTITLPPTSTAGAASGTSGADIGGVLVAVFVISLMALTLLPRPGARRRA